MNILTDVKINITHKTPIYLQIANFITENIEKGNIKYQEKLPSINIFSEKYNVSRDTVFKAYDVLKNERVVVGRKGKGTYINERKFIFKSTILFLVNDLSPCKLRIYESFINSLDKYYHSDLEIYNHDESMFVNIIENNIDRYDYYVIIPHFKTLKPSQNYLEDLALRLLKYIPLDKLIVIDNDELPIGGNNIETPKSLENDIYESLKKHLHKISKYKKLNLVLSEKRTYPCAERILAGFMKFCNEELFEFVVLDRIKENQPVNSKDLFIVNTDEDLINLLDVVNLKKYKLGKDIGIISYDETPFKRFLNIAVISTNFNLIGETAANMVINKKKGRIKIPFNFIDRSSI